MIVPILPVNFNPAPIVAAAQSVMAAIAQMPGPQATFLDLVANPGDTHQALIPFPPVPPAPPVPGPVWATPCSPVSTILTKCNNRLSAHINAVAITGAKTVHVIPHIAQFTVPPSNSFIMPPEHSTEIFMGSQFVLTGGKPTAKIPYSLAMTCCNPVNLPSAMASVPIATRLVIIGGGIIVDFLAMFANMATSLLGFRFFSAYGNWFMNLGGPFATEAMRRVAQQFVQLVTVDAAKAVVDGTKSMAEGNGFWLGFGNSYAQSAVNRVIGAVNPVPGAGGDAINGVVSNLAQEGVDNAITGS